MRWTAVTAILLLAFAGLIATADSSEADNIGIAVHANGDDAVTGYVVAREDNGNRIDPADLPEVPAGWQWFWCPRPGPGTAVNTELELVDFETPVLSPRSIYAWDPADNPGPTPMPKPADPTAIPTGTTEAILICVLVSLVALAWMMNRD